MSLSSKESFLRTAPTVALTLAVKSTTYVLPVCSVSLSSKESSFGTMFTPGVAFTLAVPSTTVVLPVSSMSVSSWIFFFSFDRSPYSDGGLL